MTIVDGVDLSILSVDELKALKLRWYQRARDDGSISACYRVVRELGTEHPKKHGSWWDWSAEGIEIRLDDYNGYLSVGSSARGLVCSTDYGCGLFVPGDWMDVIRQADVEAQGKIAVRDVERANRERAALLRELGGAT